MLVCNNDKEKNKDVDRVKIMHFFLSWGGLFFCHKIRDFQS